MERYLLDCSEKNEEIDAKETFAKFSLDAIATSAFGIDLDTFKDPDNVFAKMVKELQRAKGSESGTPFKLLILILSLNFPIFGKIFTIEQFSVKGTSFLKNALLKTVEMRKNGGKRRNDIIDHVLDLEKNNPDAMKNVSGVAVGSGDGAKALPCLNVALGKAKTQLRQLHQSVTW